MAPVNNPITRNWRIGPTRLPRGLLEVAHECLLRDVVASLVPAAPAHVLEHAEVERAEVVARREADVREHARPHAGAGRALDESLARQVLPRFQEQLMQALGEPPEEPLDVVSASRGAEPAIEPVGMLERRSGGEEPRPLRRLVALATRVGHGIE